MRCCKNLVVKASSLSVKAIDFVYEFGRAWRALALWESLVSLVSMKEAMKPVLPMVWPRKRRPVVTSAVVGSSGLRNERALRR